MGFKSALGSTMGVLTGVAVSVFSIVPGCQEAWKENPPGVSNTQQFFAGAVRGPVDALKGAAEGLSNAFSAQDVEKVLDDAGRAGRTLQEGVDRYQQRRSGDSTSASGGAVEPGVVLPPYEPRPIPGDAPQEPGK